MFNTIVIETSQHWNFISTLLQCPVKLMFYFKYRVTHKDEPFERLNNVWFLMFMIPATHAPQLYIWIYELGQPLQSYIKLYRQFSNTKVAEECAL